jgi:hypothetical protein
MKDKRSITLQMNLEMERIKRQMEIMSNQLNQMIKKNERRRITKKL